MNSNTEKNNTQKKDIDNIINKYKTYYDVHKKKNNLNKIIDITKYQYNLKAKIDKSDDATKYYLT